MSDDKDKMASSAAKLIVLSIKMAIQVVEVVALMTVPFYLYGFYKGLLLSSALTSLLKIARNQGGDA